MSLDASEELTEDPMREFEQYIEVIEQGGNDYFQLPTINNNKLIVAKNEFLTQIRRNPLILQDIIKIDEK